MVTSIANNFSLPAALSASATDTSQGTATSSAQALGKDEFLQLMIAQLKNQDPINPVKNEDYIAQLATFSSLEQLIAIKTGVNQLAGIETDADTAA
jgi:flagellar basal-body rod modification protein FlgD